VALTRGVEVQFLHSTMNRPIP